MQVSIETTSGLERRMIIGIPADRIDGEVDARLKKNAAQVRIDGFRPGKVPMKVLKQRFGPGVRQEVLQEVLSESFQEAVNKENLRPAGMPAIEAKTNEPGRDFEYIATFEIYPEVELADFSKIELTRQQASVEDADVDKMIDQLREQQGSFEAVERAAAAGDEVTIDYLGKKDGEAFEGGSAEDAKLELGSGRMIPGFEDGIIGMSAGESKDLELSFPEDYHNEELKGAAVVFTITVKQVAEKKLPELDDEFFSKFGVAEGGEEAFRKEVRDNMERELSKAQRTRLKNRLMDKVRELHPDIQIPKALVKQEISALKQQTLQQFGGGAGMENLDIDSLLPDDMFQEQADNRVKLGLVLNAIIQQQSLTADADKVRALIEEEASTYENPEEVVNYFYANQQQLQQFEYAVMEDTIVEQLLEKAQVSDESVSYETMMSPEPAPEA